MSTSKSTAADDPRQPLFPSHLVKLQSDVWAWLDICPHSQTMTAYDIDLRDNFVYALPCNQWSCRHCAVRKTRSLAHKTEKARPNRLCTLTCDPALYESPRHAFDATRRQLPEWVKVMRDKFGEVEYLRVTELTRKGWPHYHLLIRSGYIPHPVARDTWTSLTGATIVDIRPVKKIFNTYVYLLKYLTKMHRIEWTGRHVSYSRGFFANDRDEAYESHQIHDRELHAMHPSRFLTEFASGCTVFKVTPRSFLVSAPDFEPADNPPPASEQALLFARAPTVQSEGL